MDIITWDLCQGWYELTMWLRIIGERPDCFMQRLRVKEIAQAKGFTMAGLSRKADINLKTMQAIYRDPYRDVAYSTLSKLSKALEVPITDLVEELPDNNKKS